MKRYVRVKKIEGGVQLKGVSEFLAGPIDTNLFGFQETRVPWYGGALVKKDNNIINFPALKAHVTISFEKNLVSIEGWENDNIAFYVDLYSDSGKGNRPKIGIYNGKKFLIAYSNSVDEMKNAISDLREQFFEEGKKDDIQELILAEGEETSEKGLYFAIENGSLCFKAAVADFDKVFETFETADKLEAFENALDIAREEAEKL